MGLFDKIFSSPSATSSIDYTPLTDYEAWVAILYAAMSADGEVSEVEIDAMARLLIFKNKFANVEIIPFYRNAAIARNQFGPHRLIDSSAPLVKEEDRPTVLALAAELVLSNGIIDNREKGLLEYITHKLEVESELAAWIVEVILIKNRDNRILVD